MEIRNQHQRKIREARLEFVSQLYKKGYSIRKIADMTTEYLEAKKPISPSTIHGDIEYLLKEWRNNRITNIDDATQLELERIDMSIMELWEAWEKSKTNQSLKFSRQKGKLQTDSKKDKEGESDGKITPTEIEKGVKETVEFGDPRYITEIRFQLIERRKLLGLYSPEKTELTGKDGQPLNPSAKVVNLSEFTEEEKSQLLLIARRVEK